MFFKLFGRTRLILALSFTVAAPFPAVFGDEQPPPIDPRGVLSADEVRGLLPTYRTLREMDAKARKKMHADEAAIGRLRQQVISSLKCEACGGNGRGRSHSVQSGYAYEIKEGACQVCGGGKIMPHTGFHDALAKYRMAVYRHQFKYQFDHHYGNGFETWIFQNIRTTDAVARLNRDAFNRLSGNIDVGDSFLFAVEAFTEVAPDGAGYIVQAMMAPDLVSGRYANLMLLFRDRPIGISKGSRFLVLAYHEGDVIYETIEHKEDIATILTAARFKIIDAETLPWDPNYAGAP